MGTARHQTVSWFGMLSIAEDLVRGIKTFFHCYLIFFSSYNFFFFGVLYSSIIFHLFIPSVDIVCTMYNGFISENKKSSDHEFGGLARCNKE